MQEPAAEEAAPGESPAIGKEGDPAAGAAATDGGPADDGAVPAEAGADEEAQEGYALAAVAAEEEPSADEPEEEPSADEPEEEPSADESEDDSASTEALPGAEELDAPEAAATGPGPTISERVWQCLEAEEFALAARLAATAEVLEPDSLVVPPWLCDAVGMARDVLDNDDVLVAQLWMKYQEMDPDRLFLRDEPQWNHAIRLLCSAATVVPAVVAPQSGPGDILGWLEPRDALSATGEFWANLSEFARSGLALQAAGTSATAVWQGELDAASGRVRGWREQQRTVRSLNNYVTAATMLHSAIDEQDYLGSLFDAAERNDASDAPVIDTGLQRLPDRRAVDRLGGRIGRGAAADRTTHEAAAGRRAPPAD